MTAAISLPGNNIEDHNDLNRTLANHFGESVSLVASRGFNIEAPLRESRKDAAAKWLASLSQR